MKKWIKRMMFGTPVRGEKIDMTYPTSEADIKASRVIVPDNLDKIPDDWKRWQNNVENHIDQSI